MAPMAFDVRGAGFHARHMRLTQAQFRGVFDGDDALVFRNVGRQDVQQSGFTGAGSTRNDNV